MTMKKLQKGRMTMSEAIETLIQQALDQDYNKANKTFNDIISVKMTDVLDQEQIRLADQIYNGVEPEDEDDEDQMELDLEDEDIEDEDAVEEEELQEPDTDDELEVDDEDDTDEDEGLEWESDPEGDEDPEES